MNDGNHNNTKEVTLSPSLITSIRMLWENDEKKVGGEYGHYQFGAYLEHIVSEGYKQRKRSIEYTFKRREQEKLAEDTKKGIEQFQMLLLQQPNDFKTLESLLTLGTQCKVPASLVLEYHAARTKAATQAQDQK